MTPVTAVGRERNEARAGGRRLPRIFVGVLSVVSVAGLTGCDDEATDPEAAAAVTEQEMPTAEVVDAIPAEEAEVSLVLTGEDGPDGCRYDGPAVMLEGAFAASAVNESDVTITVNLDPLADGYGYEDWLAANGLASADEMPVVADGSEASNLEWLGGNFRPIFFQLPPGETQSFETIPVVPGEYLVACWSRDGMTGRDARVWAADTLTVLPEDDA